MKESKGLVWKVATALFAVLLIGAIVAIVVLVVSSNDTKTKDRDKIASLEKQVKSLQDQVTKLEAQSAPAPVTIVTSQPSSGTQKSDKAIVEEMALAEAKQANASVPWTTGGTQIIGDWARVGVGAPQQYQQQGWISYYHKVNGTWTFVTSGTGLQQSDIPGAPAELFD